MSKIQDGEWNDDDDERQEFTGCSFEHGQDEHCPECCSFGGVFAGGTEECEFCEYADACREDLSWLIKEGKL